ncbi:kinase-like protein, partial [Choiromyces venosus 120613-1]
MNKDQPGLVELYRLETEFFPNHVRHTNHARGSSSRSERVMEDWSQGEVLGHGGFSVVHRELESRTGRCRAVKTIDKRRLPTLLDCSRELLVMAILAKVSHESLFVTFLGWFEDRDTLYITMEYLEKGDLRRYIGKPLEQETVQKITKQVLECLDAMHRNGIAHRDLKPEVRFNIFVVSMSPVWVKLRDFGISKRIRAQDSTSFRTQVSTRVYAAPEVLGLDSNSETSEYTNAVDIWSLGCVIYELLAGSKLFPTEGVISYYFFGRWIFPEDELRRLSPTTSDSGISLIKSMISLQAGDRPTVLGSLGHTWISSLESNSDGDV